MRRSLSRPRRGRLVRAQQHVDRGVAVRVHEKLEVVSVHLLEPCVDLVLRKRQLALPVLLAAGAVDEIGRREECRPTLRRAVERDLDAAELQAIPVLPERSGRVVLEHGVEVEDEGQRDDVDEIGAGRRNALHDRDVLRVCRAFLGGGDAGRRVEHLAGLGPLHLLRRRGRWQGREDGQERRLHDQAVGFVRAVLAHDDAARWRLRVRRNAELLQGRRIEHAAVQRHVAHQHGLVREVAVEIVAVQHAAAGHAALVVAVGDDQLARRDLPRVAILLQLCDDRVDVLAGPGRRANTLTWFATVSALM